MLNGDEKSKTAHTRTIQLYVDCLQFHNKGHSLYYKKKEEEGNTTWDNRIIGADY